MSAEEYLKEKFKDHPLTIKWPEQLPKIMESYAREYHAKEMEKVLDIPMHVIDKGCRENSREDFFKYGSNAKFIKGAKWLLNHLKQISKE